MAVKLLFGPRDTRITGEARVSEPSTTRGLGKTSINRFISILRDLGYLDKNQNKKKYFAMLKVFKIGSMVRGSIGLTQHVHPYTEKLSRQFHGTINTKILARETVWARNKSI